MVRCILTSLHKLMQRQFHLIIIVQCAQAQVTSQRINLFFPFIGANARTKQSNKINLHCHKFLAVSNVHC